MLTLVVPKSFSIVSKKQWQSVRSFRICIATHLDIAVGHPAAILGLEAHHNTMSTTLGGSSRLSIPLAYMLGILRHHIHESSDDGFSHMVHSRLHLEQVLSPFSPCHWLTKCWQCLVSWSRQVFSQLSSRLQRVQPSVRGSG